MISVFTVVSMVFTVYIGNKSIDSLKNSTTINKTELKDQNFNKPPDFNENKDNNSSGNEENKANTNNYKQRPNRHSENNNSMKPPDIQNEDSNASGETNDNRNTIPKMPPDMSDNNTKSIENNITDNNSLAWYYYVIFGVESLVLSIVITYMIMSRFNRERIKETFNNSDKVMIYILLNIILTFILSISLIFLTNIITTII